MAFYMTLNNKFMKKMQNIFTKNPLLVLKFVAFQLICVFIFSFSIYGISIWKRKTPRTVVKIESVENNIFSISYNCIVNYENTSNQPYPIRETIERDKNESAVQVGEKIKYKKSYPILYGSISWLILSLMLSFIITYFFKQLLRYDKV